MELQNEQVEIWSSVSVPSYQSMYILFCLNLTIHFCRLNTAINKVGCGLINDRHDYSKKVVGCGTPTDKVEVWDIANRLVYKTTHDCPNTGYGNFKELDNNYHDHEDFNTT